MKLKRLFLILSIFSLFLYIRPAAAAELKVAYVDAQKVLDNSKAGKRTKATIEEYVKSRQKIIDLEEEELKRMDSELAKQAAVLSPEARREKEEVLKRKFAEYQKRAADLRGEVDNKKIEVLKEFNQGLEETVKKVAEKDGYIMIFDKNPMGGPLIYAKENLDITDKVVAEYDKKTSN